MTRLDRVATVQARIGWKALTADEYVDDGYIFLATPNIKSRDIDFENVNYISTFRYEESPELKLKLGDVLLAKDGSTLGIANYVRHLPGPATVNGSIAVVRPYGVEPSFLTYWLQGQVIQSRIQELKDGMGVPHLFQQDIRKLPVPDLEPDEQRRIAGFLDDRVARIDRIIAARQSQLRSIREVRLSSLDQVVRDAGPPQRLAWSLRLAAVGVVVNPSSYFQEEGVPFVHGYNVRDGFFDLSDLKKMSPSDSMTLGRSRLRADDVLVVRAGYPGRAAVVPSELEGGNCASVLLLRPGPNLAPHWLATFMNSPVGKSQVKQAQYGAAQEVVNLSDVLSFRIPLPERHEQERRLERLGERESELQSGCELIEKQIAVMVEYKQSLIAAAVTGELDVTTVRSGLPG